MPNGVTNEQRLVQQAQMLTNDLAELQRIIQRAGGQARAVIDLCYNGASPRIEALRVQLVLAECMLHLDRLRYPELDSLAGQNPEPGQWTHY